MVDATHILTLLSSLRTQNCTIGMSLRGNETPVLSSTFEAVKRNPNFDDVPLFLPQTKNERGPVKAATILTYISQLYVYVHGFEGLGHLSISQCMLLLLENVAQVKGKTSMLMEAATKNFLIIVGDHDFRLEDESKVPIIHLNQHGLIQIYCPAIENVLLPMKLSSAERFHNEHN